LETKNITTELYSLANQYLAGGMEFELIREKLLQRCGNEDIVSSILSHVKKEYYLQRREEGTAILGVGLVVILTGFVITCFNYHSNQSVTFTMYGLTSLGILIVFWGLYKIIG
jgi:hypothetical protein